MKPKFEEGQDAHFFGKQFTLHGAIVQSGQSKYVYHLSGDTTHDLFFVHRVLIDISTKWGIENETVIIKSDDAPTPYKNNYEFPSMQKLPDM